ncbi:unnamed protein product [Cercopithifilaria johnstoni]|uniref:Uncharacterized protein n=1 Tax=Cercopithifilaria johnstoni TaxID=2874296 RepID=A0A8J2M2Z3_9BILA|nr:unnamed protein product [Cercopithifilaria johnstoni]
MLNLKKWISIESGAYLPNKSIGQMMKNRELGKRRRQYGDCTMTASNRNGSFTMAEKANLANRFFPNRDDMISVSQCTLLRCMHLNSDRLVSLSQDNILNFHLRNSSQHYELLNRTDLPSANSNVVDIASGSMGEHLAYTTLDAYVYYFHIDRIRQAARWNLFHAIQPIAALRWNICSSICFNMDDNYLLVVEAGGRISIISTKEPSRYSFQAHQRDISAISSSKVNPNIFYTGSPDGFWKVWDSRSNSNRVPVQMHASRSLYNVANIDSDSQDKYVVTSYTSGTRIDAWDLRFFGNQPFVIYRDEDEATTPFARGMSNKSDFLWRARFSPQITGHRYVYANSSSGNIYIFDITTGETQRLHRHGTLICDSTWHPNISEIACGTV